MHAKSRMVCFLETAKPSGPRRPTIHHPPGSAGYASSLASALKTGLQSDAVAEVKVKMRKLTPMLYASRTGQMKNHEVEYRKECTAKSLHPRGWAALFFAVMSHNAVGNVVGKVSAAVNVVMHHKRHWCVMLLA